MKKDRNKASKESIAYVCSNVQKVIHRLYLRRMLLDNLMNTFFRYLVNTWNMTITRYVGFL